MSNIVQRFWARVEILGPNDCWEWKLGRSPRGYGKIKVHGRHLRAHRVAYELTHAPIPSGMFVCHHCDNPPCCNPAHLFVGTPADNVADMVAKGRAIGAPTGMLNGQNLHPERRPAGERNGMARLTLRDVMAIRSRYRGRGRGVTQQELADEYGVARSAISRIVTGARWAEPDATDPFAATELANVE